MKDHKSFITEETNNLFWLFLLQGICLIALGVLIIYQPLVLVALVAAGFFVFGLTSIITSVKVKSFGKKMEKLPWPEIEED